MNVAQFSDALKAYRKAHNYGGAHEILRAFGGDKEAMARAVIAWYIAQQN